MKTAFEHPIPPPFAEVRFAKRRLVAPTTPRFARRAARKLIFALLLLIVGILCAPWQQSVPGVGQVVALDPLERAQTIQAPVEGQVVEWYVREGSRVKQGDSLVKIVDNDPLLMDRLAAAVAAAKDKLQSCEDKIDSYGEQIRFYQSARDLQIAIAEGQLEIVKQKLRGEQQLYTAAEAAALQAKQQYDRYRQLLEQKLASPQEVEVETSKLAKANAELQKYATEVSAAMRDVNVKQQYVEYARTDADAKIVESRAKLQTAEGERAAAKDSLLKAERDLSRLQTQLVTAPRDGVVVRLIANQGGLGRQVHAGAPLLHFVPDFTQRAVELWVDGNDAPWVTPGRHVRLQFEGWPALQFTAGIPQASLGTFGGEVLLVDAAPNALGKFRVLVVPSQSDSEPAWPGINVDSSRDVRRELRQGVRVNGWILLNQVTMGYELWRQLNGFPPAIAPEKHDPYHDGGAAKSEKKSKSSGDEEKK
jgi:multidrug resistance efflux pump